MFIDSAPFRFSLRDVLVSQRSRAIHELRERGILPIEPLANAPIQLDLLRWSLPGLAILSGTLGGVRHFGHVQFAGDDLFFGLNLRGEAVIEQAGEELAARAGDSVALNMAAGTFTVVRPAETHFIGLRVPRKSVDPLLLKDADQHARIIPEMTGSVTLLRRYIEALLRSSESLSSDAAPIVAGHVHDLIALSLGASGDGRALVEDRSVPAARLRAIKSDILAHLEDSSLSLPAIAARHRVTSRYIHRLFERDGTTYTRFVLQQRLERACRLLRNPRYADRTISSIAFDVGFGDLSYFNRTFYRRYQRTASKANVDVGGHARPIFHVVEHSSGHIMRSLS